MLAITAPPPQLNPEREHPPKVEPESTLRRVPTARRSSPPHSAPASARPAVGISLPGLCGSDTGALLLRWWVEGTEGTVTKGENKNHRNVRAKTQRAKAPGHVLGGPMQSTLVCREQSGAPWTRGRPPPAGLRPGAPGFTCPLPLPPGSLPGSALHCPAANATTPAPGAMSM